MKSLETVRASLPISVRNRLATKCQSVREAVACCGIAREVAGARGALLVALEVYVIPIQLAGGCAVEDLFWYIEETTDLKAVGKSVKKGDYSVSGVGTYRSQKNLVDMALSKNFTYLCSVFRSKMVSGKRLLSEPSSPDLNEFQRSSSGCWWSGAKTDTLVFPKKKNKSVVKQNLRFDHVWRDVRDRYPELAYVVGTEKCVLEGMYNDEAVGWLIWMCGACTNMSSGAPALCAIAAKRENVLKKLNTMVKSLGMQKMGWGCDICELTTLAGRGVNVDQPSKDVSTRISEKRFKDEKAAVCDKERLAHCIKEVLNGELATEPTWDDPDKYWTRRWLYTKAGAHSQYPEERLFGERLDLPERPTRREFAEVAPESVVGKGEPRVDAGHSYKEEHGKTRHIYSCDTASYFTFDYLLRPLEAVWRNRRVLLDPGRELQSSRYQELAAKTGCRYMLDFDDFNSQHEIWAMQEVIRQACEGAPEDIRDWAVKSWDEMHVHWLENNEMHEAKMVGTLPSGHRATTFVNTVLNAAYCMYASRDGMDDLDSYHCGDDVVIFGQEWKISEYISDMVASPFRVNPSKQSVGFEVGEFLRVCFWETEASGYGARGVSSLVSGNWVTETLLDKRSYVETLLRGLWTICARFNNAGLGVVALTSLKYRVPELGSVAFRLVTHRLSWGGTPVARETSGTGVEVLRPTGGMTRFKGSRLVSYKATRDFMDNHIDYTLLEASGYSPGQLENILRQASEKPRDAVGEEPLTYTSELSNAWYVAEYNSLARLAARRDVGRDQALNILQMMLTKVEWYKLVGVVRNVVPTAYGITGKSPWPLLSTYKAPMSDLMSLRSQVSCTTAIMATYPVRV